MSNGNDRDQVLPPPIARPAGATKPTEMVERTAIAGELAFSFLSFVDEHASRDGGVDTAERFAIDGGGMAGGRPRSADGRIDALCVDDAALRRHLAEERRALILTCAELHGPTEPDIGEATS